jgi:hypothetical protein
MIGLIPFLPVARHELAREDLLAEAKALVERVEIARRAAGEHVVIGFRRDGSASCYFGSDSAFHFNSRGELRRAYLDDELLKAERRRLVALRRRRTGGEVQLLRRELTAEQSRKVLDDLTSLLAEIAHDLEVRDSHLIGQVPETADVLGRAHTLLKDLAVDLKIAQGPHAR